MKVIFIGAGRLATHLAIALYNASYTITQVYSRTIASATTLADIVKAKAVDNVKEIQDDADLYIFSITDSALTDIIKQIPANGGLWIHTSGSMPIDIFKGLNKRYGVLYPFQTFSKDRNIDFEKIPLFVEAESSDSISVLQHIGNSISSKIYTLSSEKRKFLHLTGVFACNFVNYMYVISKNILEKENIPFDSILPLIDETAAKVHALTPEDAQTGPAVRYDENIIDKHIAMLDDPKLKTIYTLLSESIYETKRK